MDSSASSSTSPQSAPKPRSCDSCRLRRVKCVREPFTNENCKQCQKKGIRCTILQEPNPRRKMNPDGAIIAKARATFGKVGSEQQRTGHFERGVKYFNALPSSPNSRLGDLEIESTLALQLMELFFSNGWVQLHPIEWHDFRARFVAAGRRPDQMAEQEEVLCAFLLAKGASLSDHPLLLGGHTAGTSAQFNALDNEDALAAYSEVGNLRQTINRKLFARAVAMADAKGTMRSPCPESIASLLLLYRGLPYEDRLVQGRIYTRTISEHIRILDEQNEAISKDVKTKDDFLSHRAWNAWLLDCLMVARTGIRPSFDEEDMPRLSPNTTLPFMDLVRRLTTTSVGFPTIRGYEVEYFWTCITPFLREIGTIGLRIGEFQSAKARRLPFQDDKFMEIISSIYFLQLSLPYLEPALLKLEREFLTVFPTNALYFVSLISIAWSNEVCLLESIIQQREGDCVPDVRKAAKLDRVAPLVNGLLINAARTIAYVFHRLRKLGKKLASFSSLTVMAPQLPMLAYSLVHYEIKSMQAKVQEALPFLPGLTDHPPPETAQCTLERKVLEITWLMEGITSLSYLHADSALNDTFKYLLVARQHLMGGACGSGNNEFEKTSSAEDSPSPSTSDSVDNIHLFRDTLGSNFFQASST
ncbi:hypothetical protein BT69DRAFT_1352068 [Atractiella rhizophila]|nr:hypothetical protein BT69DRAFT_1352068 [Atractiella rhizophila]